MIIYHKELRLKCDVMGCDEQLTLDETSCPGVRMDNIKLTKLRGMAQKRGWQLLPRQTRCRCPGHRLEA